ncbi:regulatory protein RecX [Thermophilibacter mediterraneus]|uniref:regulatory protein RecX n=1 Tax=Thermophilibacter mediterraneus TaxID=1871031 RepID=UPI00093008EF|nr:regulatory protein RecX [Thermophilibacter mediterraneus]
MGPLDWEASAPSRGSASRSGSRPRGVLRVSSDECGEEELALPVAVARRLAALRERGAALPEDRAALLDLVGSLCDECGRERVEALLGRRDYSARELRERLVADGYPARSADRLVERARGCGLVDDARYGAAFARSKALAGWGRLRVERELERRGVSADDVPGWPEEFFGDELSRARELVSRRRPTGRGDYARTVRFLCGRGFSYDAASEVAREFARRAGETAERGRI